MCALAFAEQQPGASLDAERRALLQEGAERRHAGAGTAHDDMGARIGGQAEVAGLDAGADRSGTGGAIGQEAAGDAVAHPAPTPLTHHRDAQMGLARRHALRGGDGIQPRPQRRQRAQQIGERRAGGRKCLQQVEQVRIGGFRAVLSLGKRVQRVGVSWMHGCHREQVQRAVEWARDVQLMGQRVPQRLVVAGAECGERGVHQRWIVGHRDAE